MRHLISTNLLFSLSSEALNIHYLFEAFNKMIATPETNTDCFRATIIAYRLVRLSGEKDLPAYYSAREAYRSHQPNCSNK